MERILMNDSFSGRNLSELVPASDQVGPITTMKRSVSKPATFPAPLLVLTGKEWHTSRHAPDKASQDLSSLPVTCAS
jgi:hypothetical protein